MPEQLSPNPKIWVCNHTKLTTNIHIWEADAGEVLTSLSKLLQIKFLSIDQSFQVYWKGLIF